MNESGLPTQEGPSPSSRREEGSALLPGMLLAERYRVVALLGRGGMGEVYRAEDLKLGQAVALKFLPRSLERDLGWRSRLLAEVRIARQISHPNVCRVYDVGETEGRHFLSMEFIDGEDLASLLRRIGRLPPEKAVQIARQLCAGLAAAHEQGVLHRDLKPANVMIDGRGRARITDFGLAAAQQSVRSDDIRSGTPAYMAPEQLEGREVSTRSDVYALGLVLYEVFAGRPAFELAGSREELRQRRSGLPDTPSSHVEGLDPAVERAILRCLDPDPSLRPGTALAVSASLPGGDPLAAALAAGETPSPEVVAAAPTEGRLRPSVVIATLAAFLALWGGSTVLSWWPMRDISFERSPDGLADRARDLLARLGHREKPVGRAWGYALDQDLLFRARRDPPPDLVEATKAGRAPVVRFWYRESPEHLVPQVDDRVSPTDPPFEAPHAKLVEATTDGRLLSVRVVPSPVSAPGLRATEPDWAPLFEAAGLDRADFEPTSPTWTPPDFADVQAAWLERRSNRAREGLRVQGAALGGLPVYFRVASEVVATGTPNPAATRQRGVFIFVLATFILSVSVAALWLARRNLLSGRGDRRGAYRLAAVVIAVGLGSWVVSASHAPAPAEGLLLLRFLAVSLADAAMVWAFYMALEPMLRRSAPAGLVSWTRLLAGRARDPLVGRDLLFGSLCGAAAVACLTLGPLWLWASGREPVQWPAGVENLIGVRGVVRAASQALVFAFLQAMGFLVALQLFSQWLGSRRRGAFALGALMLLILSTGHGVGVITLFILGRAVVFLFALGRLGLLASVTMLWIFMVNALYPIVADPSAWYASQSAAAFVLASLPAAWGAWVAIDRRAPAAMS